MADRYVKRVTQQMLECAHLAATGEHSMNSLAEKYGKTYNTIRRWLQNPAVQEEYRSILRASEMGIVAKARRVLDKSMSSNAGDGYLALQAAQTALQRYDNAVMGNDQQEIVVHITGGMPHVGMPPRTDEE
jgi:hypothetical protein